MVDKPWLGSRVTEPVPILVERDVRGCEAKSAAYKRLIKNRARVALASEMLAIIHQMLSISVFSLRKLILINSNLPGVTVPKF
jgi:hypothetical protein